MANGQQLADKNYELFLAWRAAKTDEDFRAMTIRGVLSRKEVAKECGFARSALGQNPRIKAGLHDLETNLRARGVMPPLVESNSDGLRLRERGSQRAVVDAERLRRLEQENASLRAENMELKRCLDKHSLLREALSQSGRLPR